MAVVLGLSNSHNGSVALICDGKVKAAIQAERLSRIKRQSLSMDVGKDLVKECVQYCLNVGGLKYSDLDAIGLCSPWKARRINNNDLFDYIGGVPDNYVKTFYIPHHMAHMEYIIHFGANKPGLVLVIDGSGSLEADRALFNVTEKQHPDIINHTVKDGKEVISGYWFDGKDASLIYRHSPSIAPKIDYNLDSNGLYQSIGHYWEWASLYCCGSRHEAGKVMGLAGFGKSNASQKTSQNILIMNQDHKIELNYAKIKSLYRNPNIFGLDLTNSTHHQNVASEVQSDTEITILQLLKILKEMCPTDTVYLSGGVALNVVANEQVIRSKIFENVILNGSVEDNGTAIGAGLSAHLNLGYGREYSKTNDYYGKLYTDAEIIDALGQYNFPYEIFEENDFYPYIAKLISKSKVVGWFQGRSEFGPRALGNRSILANPTDPATKYVLDLYMKRRDNYRPYAPVVTEESVSQYFDIDQPSPVMMRSAQVLDKRLCAVTHIDGSARVQTVNRSENKPLHSLLLEINKAIGFPVLLNTSFNLPGEPIVESPSDALSSFARGGLDYLCLHNIIVSRQ